MNGPEVRVIDLDTSVALHIYGESEFLRIIVPRSQTRQAGFLLKFLLGTVIAAGLPERYHEELCGRMIRTFRKMVLDNDGQGPHLRCEFLAGHPDQEAAMEKLDAAFMRDIDFIVENAVPVITEEAP